MNDNSWPKFHTSTLAVLLAGLSLGLPIACSDDDSVPPLSEGGNGGGDGTGGAKSSGGAKASGGSKSSGGAGGGPSSGGSKSSGGSGNGGSGSGGTATGGSVNTGGSDLDGGDEGGDDGGQPSACSGAFSATTANLCLTLQPEAVASATPADITLNNFGTVLVQVFNKEYPTGQADIIAQKWYPGPPTGAQVSEQVAINQIPSIGFNNLPPGNVYVRATFIDNPAWLQNTGSLTWGLQVGGLNLNGGIRPAPAGRPAVRAIAVTAGEERAQSMKMWAMRKFTATVMLSPGSPANPPTQPEPIPPPTPADDGEGPLSVGVFDVQAPAEAAIYGGVEGRCVNVAAGPVTGVQGFFYTLATPPAGGTTMYFGAQVNDFNTSTIIQGAPGGALISITPAQTLPPSQKATVQATAYSVLLDTYAPVGGPSPLFLTAVNQVPNPKPPGYKCPVVVPPDGGAGDGG